MTVREQYREAQKDLTHAYMALDMAEPDYVEVAVAKINLASARCDALLKELKAGAANA